MTEAVLSWQRPVNGSDRMEETALVAASG